MSHIHRIYDTDLHFIIDPITRKITSESGKVTLMQNDHLSERFTFEIPRYIEGHDMGLTDKVEIHYINASSANRQTVNKDIYTVDDLQISPDSDDIVICSWLISKNATIYEGTLHFVLRFVCYSDDEIEYQWFTDIYKGIGIAPAIYNTDVIDQKYDIDVVENWKRDVINAFLESDAYKDAEMFRDEASASAYNASKSADSAKQSEDHAISLLNEVIQNIEAGTYNGVDGIQGPKGDKGDKGDTGAVGPMGPTGEIGPQGPQGLRGPEGRTGATGATGQTGPQGIRGAQGMRGPEGATGAVGPQGMQGPQGIKGDQGIRGPEGAIGPTGPQGPQGPKGDPGESGIIAPVNGFFTLSVDADGNLYSVHNTEDEPVTFEYDSETGDLYYVQEE